MGGGGVTVMGVVASEIEADEAVTSPAMISCKHLQGGPRPPDMPLQELTQELSSGTKQVMLRGCCTLLHGERSTLWSLYPTILQHHIVTIPYHIAAHFTLVVPYPTAPKFYVRNYWYCLFICSGVEPFILMV